MTPNENQDEQKQNETTGNTEIKMSYVAEMQAYFQSKYENFPGQSVIENYFYVGAVYQEEHVPMGIVDWLVIDVLRLEDLLDNKKINGLIILDSTKGKRAIIDQDEIDNFIATIQIFTRNISGSTNVKYKAAKFRSRSGFEVSCYAKESKIGMSITFEGRNYDQCREPLDEQHIRTLLLCLQQAKKNLDV
jgi:hypothetical protein